MLGRQVIWPGWPAPENVRSVSTTRLGGLSEGPYATFNLAGHVGDEPSRVRDNRGRLIEELNLPAEPTWLDQVHGSDVVCIDSGAVETAADAGVSRRPGQVCAVMTADCLPVLICDTAGTRVAAVHAGWRGIAAGVIEAAVLALQPGDGRLLAWLGPAIGPDVYEIDRPVRSQLLAADPGATDAFRAVGPDHWLADLGALARRRLRAAGVSEIYGGGLCTFADPGRFYSYRRDGQCGRMATLIWLAGRSPRGGLDSDPMPP